jgi:hypothetical protein
MYNTAFKYHKKVITNNDAYPWQIQNDKYSLRGKMLNEDSGNALVNRMKMTHKHTVRKFLDGARIEQAKPRLGLASGRLYREVSLIGSVPMFNRFLTYKEKGILKNAAAFPYPHQQGVHISKLLPWDGLETVIPAARKMGYAADKFSTRYGAAYSRGERENIDWGPHHLNFMNKYGKFRGPYSAKLYKSIMYKGVSESQNAFDTKWRARRRSQVWGKDPQKAKEEHLKVLSQGRDRRAKYRDAGIREGNAEITLNYNLGRLYRKKKGRELLRQMRVMRDRDRGRGRGRAGVDHEVQLNSARQPALQVHDVQPADVPGPNVQAPNVPPPPMYVSPDRQARLRAIQERESALWLSKLSPGTRARVDGMMSVLPEADRAATLSDYIRMQHGGLSGVADQLFASPPP